MTEIVWLCNVCGEQVDEETAWRHRAKEHPQMVHWATPVFAAEISLPKKGKNIKKSDRKKEDDELEDLSL